jgi:hypothetical protein
VNAGIDSGVSDSTKLITARQGTDAILTRQTLSYFVGFLAIILASLLPTMVFLVCLCIHVLWLYSVIDQKWTKKFRVRKQQRLESNKKTRSSAVAVSTSAVEMSSATRMHARVSGAIVIPCSASAPTKPVRGCTKAVNVPTTTASWITAPAKESNSFATRKFACAMVRAVARNTDSTEWQ